MGALRELNLYGNQIGDAGIQASADAIGSGSMGALERLWLNSNQIGDQGMVSFSAALGNGSLPALEDVDLDDNPGDSAPVDEALTNRDM
jgi:hypothetical protein